MKNLVKIIGKPTLIIFILGIICGYFFITSALPVGILSIPALIFFFKFSKEKLSVHTNLFSLIAIIFSFIFFKEIYIKNIKEMVLYLIIILVLTLIGKFIKKIIPIFMQITSLILWGILIISFLFLSCVNVEFNYTLIKILKYSSLFFSGVLGIPPSSLFIPCQSICHNNIVLSICILIFASTPAIIINIFKDFKKEYLDYRFSAIYIISLLIGIILGKLVINLSFKGGDYNILWQLSIIIPSILLFAFNVYNTNKTLKKSKQN